MAVTPRRELSDLRRELSAPRYKLSDLRGGQSDPLHEPSHHWRKPSDPWRELSDFRSGSEQVPLPPAPHATIPLRPSVPDPPARQERPYLNLIPQPFIQLAVALGLGLLVGLQRERTDSAIAGIRTFALITVLGAVAAMLGRAFGGWVVAMGLLAVAGLVTSGNLVRMREGEADPGQTTELRGLGDVRGRRPGGRRAAHDRRGPGRRGCGPASSEGVAPPVRGEDRRAGPAGDHAARPSCPGHPADPAGPGHGAVWGAQPLPDLVDGGADRRPVAGRVCGLQAVWDRGGDGAGRSPGRPHLEHGHHGQLRPPHEGGAGGSPGWPPWW